MSLDDHHSKSLGEFLGKVRIHYAITVCGNAEKTCPSIWPFAPERLFWPFDDPAAAAGDKEQQLAAFRAVRDESDARIQRWLDTELTVASESG